MGEKIHLIAVCGTGMGSFATLLKTAGHEVRGSDANVYPPMSTILERAGIGLMQGFSAANLDWGPDRVVVGNAVRRDNPEAQEAERRGLRRDSFPSAISDLFLKDRRSLVVAGTHGKTTTSALAAWCLHHAGRDPSFLVGGVLRNFGATARLGGGPHFVIEGDEYDTAYFDKGPKFLHYRPRAAIVTSVEFDHADIFADLEAVKAAFRKFAAILPEDGLLVVHEDVPEDALAGARCRLERYGLGEGADWRLASFEQGHFGGRFELFRGGEALGKIALPMTGAQNALNALAVIALLACEGLSLEDLRAGLRTFESVKRRQEVVAEEGGVTVIDDFAHHPTAVAVTLEGIRARYPGRRLVALFEPRTNTSRRAVFQEAYAGAFGAADLTIVAEVFKREALGEGERFDSERLARDIAARGGLAMYVPRAEDILGWCRSGLRAGDVVVFMSNGDFGGLRADIPRMLRARGEQAAQQQQ